MMLLLPAPNYRREDCLTNPLDMMYTPRSEEFLNQLARDIIGGRIFHSGMINHHGDIAMVFMPLALAERRDLLHLQKVGAYLFYEYLEQAGPRAINGNPCFMSFRYLNKIDTDRLGDKIKRLDAAMKAALA